jgi:hypothetical protein
MKKYKIHYRGPKISHACVPLMVQICGTSALALGLTRPVTVQWREF